MLPKCTFEANVQIIQCLLFVFGHMLSFSTFTLCLGCSPLTNSVVTASSDTKGSSSAKHTHVSFLPQTPLPWRLLHSIDIHVPNRESLLIPNQSGHLLHHQRLCQKVSQRLGRSFLENTHPTPCCQRKSIYIRVLVLGELLNWTSSYRDGSSLSPSTLSPFPSRFSLPRMRPES